ncbi:MAG: 3-oxoacyl-ACP reductase FabG [Candidatus Latescibacteria bacterium]|nr:3-oxoacyl-ACP reductase FabG [Candidatus Latescibacterota bacterium]
MAASVERKNRALVTGASKGVGRGVALALGRAGYDVVVNYHTDAAGAEETVTRLRQMGRRAVAVGANVANAAQVAAMFDRTIADLGGLEVLVNNAGVTIWGSVVEMSEDIWDRTIGTNLKGTFLCTQQAARRMIPHGGGRIINIGSGACKRPFPGVSAYNASKGGVVMFTQVSAVELGPYGITVNCVAPGAIEIERTQQEAPDYAETWAPLTPLRRIGHPDDVGDAVVFLASDQARFITGQMLYVDGGLFSQGPWPYGEKKG